MRGDICLKVAQWHSDFSMKRPFAPAPAALVHFFQEISQGAHTRDALSQGISQGAQHDQRVSALLVVGFGMPVSATHIARLTQVARVCARTAAVSDCRNQMRRGRCYAA